MRTFIEPERNRLLLLTNVNLETVAPIGSENLEKLEEQNTQALIPDRRMEAEGRNELSKGEYDRLKFCYQPETNTYVCPAGERLEKSGEVKERMREIRSRIIILLRCLPWNMDCQILQTVCRDIILEGAAKN